MCGVTRDKWRSRVFPPFLSTLYTFRRPRFGLVKVTGNDGRLKIIKLENSDLVCYSTDRTPTVEMKRSQEDGDDDDDDRQEEDGNDENRNEKTITAKEITELLYGICSTESAGSEGLCEKLKLMCHIIKESSRLMSGWTKMWGVTGDKMRSKSTFPPTLYTEDSRRRSTFDSKKVVVGWRENGSLNEEMSIGCRQDDDGNDGNNDDDHDHEEEVGNNIGEYDDDEEEEEEMIVVVVGGGGGGDEENQTEEKVGDCDQDDDGDDHGKNSKKKRYNNKKNKKKRRKKT